MLGTNCPTPPTEANVNLVQEVQQLPGLQRYLQLGLKGKLRTYQKEGAIFLARRAWALNCDPMRSGKSLQALAASVLTGASKTLIVCPALAKPVWADEVAKWLGEEAIMLEGRAGNYARAYCIECMNRGYTDTHRHCPGCKLKNGQANGTRILELGAPDRDLTLAVANAKYVIVNFDLLVAQQATDDRGRKYYRDDLPGWGPFLSQFHFDLCIADESHLLRGWSTDQTKKGKTRRERFVGVTQHIPQVWALTGTPIYGFVRDLWGPLDAISKGAFTGPSRLPFDFHVRYCDGQKGEYGWIADGASIYAQTELKDRLECVKMQRPRSMILADMPAKVRTVYRVEQDDKAVKAAEKAARLGLTGNKQGRIAKLLSQTGTAKRSTVVENVLTEMAAGDKVVVFTMLRKNAEGIANELRRKLKKSREWSARMRQVKAEMWCAHGDTPSQTRFAAARAFREHNGAAVFVTTIDAMQVAVSLKGATSVHFADLHWNPAAMLQAEDRPYEVGTRGLNIVYYVMKGTIDEHVEAVVLPKFKTQESVVGEEGAADVRSTFAGQKETLDQILDRLTAHLGGDDDDWSCLDEDD